LHLFCFYLFVHLPPNELKDTGRIRTGKSLVIGQLGELLDHTLDSPGVLESAPYVLRVVRPEHVAAELPPIG